MTQHLISSIDLISVDPSCLWLKYSKTFNQINNNNNNRKPYGIRIITLAFIILTTHFSHPFRNSNKLIVFSLKWHFKNGQYVFNKETKCDCHLHMSFSFLFEELFRQESKTNYHVIVFSSTIVKLANNMQNVKISHSLINLNIFSARCSTLDPRQTSTEVSMWPR